MLICSPHYIKPCKSFLEILPDLQIDIDHWLHSYNEPISCYTPM
ncbi:MAG: hypothetical protein sGL2_11440 [Candidatus Mesenet longicola]|nr:MAG: hypothetical protein sGL2_11440 [Candidatus Mesenet longicola]